MFNGFNIFVSDILFKNIFIQLSANIVSSKNDADIIFDDLKLQKTVSLKELKICFEEIINNNENIILKKIGIEKTNLSKLQKKIIILLFKKKKLNIKKMKKLIFNNVHTYNIENDIYKLRIKFGRNFIINENGEYFLGKI